MPPSPGRHYQKTLPEGGRAIAPPVKWLFKSKEDTDGFIRFKPKNVVKGYMQVPGVDHTELFSTVKTSTSTMIMIGITLYKKE